MVSRWPDRSLESIPNLRSVFFRRHWPVQFHGCSGLLAMRSNLPALFLGSVCRVDVVSFLPVHCPPWPVARFVSSQPIPRLASRLDWPERFPLVDLFPLPNSKPQKVLAHRSRVLVWVLRPNPALFPYLELRLPSPVRLPGHPFLGSRPLSLRVLGVPSRASPPKWLQPFALWVRQDCSGPSPWPV